MQNVVGPPPTGDAMLSQSPPQQADQLREADGNALHQADHHPRVGQHRRGQQARLVEQHAVQRQLALGEPFRCPGGSGAQRQNRPLRGTWRRPFGAPPAGIQPPLLPFPRRCSVISRAALVGTPSAVASPAAKRTTQIEPAGIAGMREKPNPAVRAMSRARLQLRMRLQHGVQGLLVAEDQRPGRFVLVPIRPERESFLDGDDKKTRFSVIILSLHTTSFLPQRRSRIERQGEVFFLDRPREAAPNRPRHSLPPIDASPRNGCLKEESPYFFLPSRRSV